MASERSSLRGGDPHPFVLGGARDAARCGKGFGAAASRKRHTTYKDYYMYVEECNQSAVLRLMLMDSSKLIPTHTQRIVARRYTDGNAFENKHPLRTVQDDGRYVVGVSDPSRDLDDEVHKAEVMRPRGGSAQARVDPAVLTLECIFLLHPRAEALYRSVEGKNIPSLAENITSALVDGVYPSGLKGHVKGKLAYVRQGKSYPHKVIKVMTRLAEE